MALRHDPGLPDYLKIMRPFRRTTAALWQLFDAVKHGKSDEANEASGVAAEEMYAADGQLERAAKRYRAHSAHVFTQARSESVAMVLLLFAAFAWFYARATRGRSVAEERSNELGQHTSEVSALAELTAARLGLPADERQRIRLAAELHDIGKAAIPDVILNKPGELDENEWAFIRRHPGRTVSDTAAA